MTVHTGAGSRFRLRTGRDRATGYAAVGIVGALVACAIVWGGGAGGDITRLADVGGWLGSSSNGTAVHVDGLTGKVDGTVKLGSTGHQVRISQSGTSILVTDQATGLISRIDPSQLTVAQTQDFGKPGVEVFESGDAAYAVDAAHGTVERIDPIDLSVLGAPVTLPAPLGHAGIDTDGTLWVPITSEGTVVPVAGGIAQTPVKVGGAGDPVQLTVAAGVPVATDAATGALTVLAASGGRLTVKLPPAATQPAAGAVLAPSTSDTAVVPLLATSDSTLVLVDTGTGTVSAVHVDTQGSGLGAPEAVNGKVYIPDDDTGSLIVYDTATGAFENRITVTGHKGHLEAFVHDGVLWVNDERDGSALVIGPDGAPHTVSKYSPAGAAPSTGSASPSSQTPSTVPSSQRPVTTSATPVRHTSSDSVPSHSDSPTPTPTPTPTPRSPSSSPTPKPTSTSAAPPQAPGTPTATSGPGTITVTFPPAAGAAPIDYTLKGAPAGAAVAPVRIPPSGQPFTFTVTGGSCDATYSFTVVARYPTTTATSNPSVAVRPCVAPTSPTNLRGTAVEHGADLTWSAPGSTGGGTPAYTVTWPGGSVSRLSSTATRIGGLTDFTVVTFRLTASTAAGTSTPAVTQQVDISTKPYPAHAQNDAQGAVNVRDAPNTRRPAIGQIPQGSRMSITVLCQETNGEFIKDSNVWSGTSYIWDKVTWGGGTAWIADIYVSTPQSANGNYTAASTPKVWSCT